MVHNSKSLGVRCDGPLFSDGTVSHRNYLCARPNCREGYNCLCCRKLVQRHIEAMYEVYKFFFGESFEQVAAYMSQGVPSHTGVPVFMPGGAE